MEKKIDWSKAPVWANAVVSSEEGDEFYVSQWGGISARQRVDHKEVEPHRCADMTAPHAWTLVQTRQAAWNGEGFPPKGTDVEVRFACEKLREVWPWHAGVVVASGQQPDFGEMVAVEANGFTVAMRVTSDFIRPIRTAEQVASEEREKACDAIYGILTSVERQGNKSDMAEALYDAGYRKQ